MSTPKVCAACGLPGHRYGRNEGIGGFDPQACINLLLTQNEALRDTLRLVSQDMHGTSTRPCDTCKQVTKAFGEPFGCVAFHKKVAAKRDARVNDRTDRNQPKEEA